MQDTIKGQVGLSTALLAVVTVAASLISAGVFQAFTDAQSYGEGFAAAAARAALGSGLRVLAERAR